MTGNAERAGGRIVVGVDGTAASLPAVRWAAQEALLRQASVHLVFVSRQYRRASYSGSPAVAPSGGNDADRAPLAAAELEAGQALPPSRLSSELAGGSPAKVLIDRGSPGAGRAAGTTGT
jgi:nucleotide-binding universal stress UspA family protein